LKDFDLISVAAFRELEFLNEVSRIKDHEASQDKLLLNEN